MKDYKLAPEQNHSRGLKSGPPTVAELGTSVKTIQEDWEKLAYKGSYSGRNDALVSYEVSGSHNASFFLPEQVREILATAIQVERGRVIKGLEARADIPNNLIDLEEGHKVKALYLDEAITLVKEGV